MIGTVGKGRNAVPHHSPCTRDPELSNGSHRVRERGPSAYAPRIPEAHVVRLWLREATPGSRFATVQGHEVRLLTVGRLNMQDGPDFTEARMEYDGVERIGEVEVHVHEHDWFLHRHERDPRFRTVMLHVALYASPAQKAPRHIPTIILADALSRPLRAAWADVLADISTTSRFACAAYAAFIPPSAVDSALRLAAAERLERKVRRVEARCAEWSPLLGASTAGRQTLYELLARALGYGGNEDAMEMLARFFPLHVLAQYSGGDLVILRAALRLAAGRDARSALPGLREALRQCGIRVPVLPKSAWRFSRVRPANSIDKRLEQLAAAVRAMSDAPWWPRLEIALLEWPQNGSSALEAQFPFFARRLSSASAVVPRLQEIFLNVVAPFMLAEGRRRRKQALCDAAAALYHRLSPAPGNRKTSELASILQLPEPWNGSIQQGLIEIHDGLCHPGKCRSCLIGTSLFG